MFELLLKLKMNQKKEIVIPSSLIIKKSSFLILTIIYEFGNVFKLHCAVDTPRLFFY